MKDIGKVTALLSELGIEFEAGNVDGMHELWKTSHPTACQTIWCAQGMDKVGGYCGFITEFYFDAGGKFISMGIWE